MPAFAYQAVDTAGKRLRGEAQAADAGAVTRTLEERGLLVLEIETAPTPGERRDFSFQLGTRREVLEVTRALASLLPAGMPLAPALGAASHVATGKVADALGAVRDRVERGEALADALAQAPGLFSPNYVGMVRVGEKSGSLDVVFERLAGQLEREEELRAKLLSASIYPLLLASLGGVAVLILLIFVIPRFAELLQGAGATLPRSTTVLLLVSQGVARAWPVLVALPFVIGALVAWARVTQEGRRVTTTIMLALPLVRTFKKNAIAAQFARMTGTLVSGGASLIVALSDSAESLTDPVTREETVRIRSRVREGSSLHQAVAEGSLFPKLLSQLIAVGEESSNLAQFLLKAAEIFEEKTTRAMQRLVTVAEPLMIVGFGSIVALVALSLLQAIYGVNAESFR